MEQTHLDGYSAALPLAAVFWADTARGRRRVLRGAAFAFARLRAVFAERFLRDDFPEDLIRKSSRLAPALIFASIHFGSAPRPAHTFDRSSGSRYFGGSLPACRGLTAAALPREELQPLVSMR